MLHNLLINLSFTIHPILHIQQIIKGMQSVRSAVHHL